MTTRTIVFDLDGTLVDTAPDLIDSLNVLFAREGLTPIAIDQGRVLIGGGVKRPDHFLGAFGIGHGRLRHAQAMGRLLADFLDRAGQFFGGGDGEVDTLRGFKRRRGC